MVLRNYSENVPITGEIGIPEFFTDLQTWREFDCSRMERLKPNKGELYFFIFRSKLCLITIVLHSKNELLANSQA